MRGRSNSAMQLDSVSRPPKASTKEDPMQVFMNTYGDIVTRTRQKLQIVKALKVMRKTKPAKHEQ